MRRLWMVFAMALLVSLPLLAAGRADQVPAKPLQLEVSTEFDGATAIAVLSWRDMSSDELGFNILRSDNNGDYRVVGTVGANTTQFRDEVGKYIAGTFTYKVRAFNAAGQSEDSNEASVWF